MLSRGIPSYTTFYEIDFVQRPDFYKLADLR
jgi:hypothetical protein